MYNSDIPTRAELPTSGQLMRSTILAAATAAVLLVTTVLPAEYGIDPTGIGRLLGLRQMGEVKIALAQEAATDARAAERRPDATELPAASTAATPAPSLPAPSAPAMAPPPAPAAAANAAVAAAAITPGPSLKANDISITLRPGEGAEVKMQMRVGARATYAWKVDGGTVNHDTHGEPANAPNSTHSYGKGRGVTSDEGVLQAAFDGNHGWFWRNRGSQPVKVNLRTNGDYAAIKRVM